MTTPTIVHIIRNLVIYLLVYIVNVETIPPDYCFHPLNKSDCNVKPTPVFSYYLSGSRCEIEYWRGCPTYNKFDNEYDCSYSCIFGWKPLVEKVVEETTTESNLLDELMKIPEENLTIIEDIVKAIDEEINLNLTETVEPDIVTTTPEASVETTGAEEEEEHEEGEDEAAEPEESESGLPEEVETP